MNSMALKSMALTGNDVPAGTGAAGGETVGLDPVLFREAMSRVGAAVHVVTTDGPAGRAGATMTAIASVTDHPATLLACLARKSRLNAILKANGVFAVNTLSAGGEHLAQVFAGHTHTVYADRFDAAEWLKLKTGAPVLGAARVAFDCVLAEMHEIGTHTVLYGEIRAVHLGDPAGALLYLDRGYKSVD